MNSCALRTPHISLRRIRITMSPRIDEISENYSTAWLTEAGFTATSVQRDRHGWDQLIEFEAPRPDVQDQLGLGAIEFTAKIQVKSTRSRKPHIPVKLSNWSRS